MDRENALREIAAITALVDDERWGPEVERVLDDLASDEYWRGYTEGGAAEREVHFG